MVDKNARLRAAELLARAKNGQLSNWQLEDLWPEAKNDAALNCILRWVWTLYSDEEESAINLSADNMVVADRCIEFLHSDIEFKTKNISSEEAKAIRKKWGREWRTDCSSPSDSDTWPFSE